MEKRESTISSLRFINYVVNDVKFKSNRIQDDKKIWKLTFDITNSTKINREKNKMEIILKVNVFKNQKEVPFNMEVEMSGFFELEGEDDIARYEANAIAIMYPYLRAIVSTYTSSANVAPVILPAINVNAMLKNKKENLKKEN